MAAANTTVISGGTYGYTLGGIKVVGAGSYAVITYGGTNAQIQKINGVVGVYTAGTHIPITAGSDQVLTFDIAYNTGATDGNIKVEVTDGATGGCSNHINLFITVTSAPTIDLTVATLDANPYCQKVAGTTDNLAASDSQTNTLTFTVSQVSIGNAPTAYSWGYKIDLPNTGLGSYVVTKGGSPVTLPLVVSGLLKATISEVYTVTFSTTTGIAPKTITATLSNVSLTETSGGGNYPETVINNNSGAVTVNTTPTIGTFN